MISAETNIETDTHRLLWRQGTKKVMNKHLIPNVTVLVLRQRIIRDHLACHEIVHIENPMCTTAVKINDQKVGCRATTTGFEERLP
jgi:hypothetical protein